MEHTKRYLRYSTNGNKPTKHYFAAVVENSSRVFELWVGWGKIGNKPQSRRIATYATHRAAAETLNARITSKINAGYVLQASALSVSATHLPSFWGGMFSSPVDESGSFVAAAKARLKRKKHATMRRHTADWNF